MASSRLRDRFFTPRVARATTSASGILVAGAGVSVGIVAGLPVVAAAGLGALAWGVRVATAMSWTTPHAAIDPFRVKEPWRPFVFEARRAQRRFHEATHRARKGPLRDRLGAIGNRVDAAVLESWRIAQAGDALSDARKHINDQAVRAELESLVPPGTTPEPGSHIERTASALQAQLDTAARLDLTIAETRDRLRLLDARLGETVTRAIELAARAQSGDELAGLGSDMDDLVGELESLRVALDETSAPAAGELASGTAWQAPQLDALTAEIEASRLAASATPGAPATAANSAATAPPGAAPPGVPAAQTPADPAGPQPGDDQPGQTQAGGASS